VRGIWHLYIHIHVRAARRSHARAWRSSRPRRRRARSIRTRLTHATATRRKIRRGLSATTVDAIEPQYILYDMYLLQTPPPLSRTDLVNGTWYINTRLRVHSSSDLLNVRPCKIFVRFLGWKKNTPSTSYQCTRAHAFIPREL